MTSGQTSDRRSWWQDAVVYQVYVRSFQDTDGDGVGDLGGVIARLDHLAWFGVDALWLSPVYPSPMLDGGYDITDFCAIDPVFGDLATFDRLVAEAHQRGIRLIIDFVPNHTSDEHPWFQASRSARADPKRDWYVWRDGRNGGPPNNWSTMLEGSAWTFDPATSQFYYHAFLPEQPDLNWRNPEVRNAMADVLRFWLARDVDGVRVDGVWHLVEDALLRDDLPSEMEIEDVPVTRGMRHVFTADRPETRTFLAGLRRVLDEFSDRVLIAEAHLPVAQTMAYYAAGAHMPFNYALISVPWDVRALAAAIDHYQNMLPTGAWPNWLLGNHDEIRIASRIGVEAARVAAMLVLTLGGTVFLYNGDELGLEDVPFGEQDLGRCPEMRHPYHAIATTPHRTPIPWDGGANGGFTSGEPWLPLGAVNETRHVAGQLADERSMLALHRSLVALRRSMRVLLEGHMRPEAAQGSVLLYRREMESARLLIALNIGDRPQTVRLSSSGTLLLSTHLDREGDRFDETLSLRANEGTILSLESRN